ncbi:MAG: type IV pili methyl-accepting chemotaxis transducer N-terminal domain-containing protein, partial [Cyanobacteria bacterium J06642_11]
MTASYYRPAACTMSPYASESNDPILKPETVNAALVNISGRQRMLSQRAAMFSLMLANSQCSEERKGLKEQLRQIIDLMESSHRSLIRGNPELNLPQQKSDAISAMYFSPPLNVDQRIRTYITAVRTFFQLPDAKITSTCPLLSVITQAASEQILPALDTVVTQYQKESEATQQAIKQQQRESYRKRCIAAEKAEKAAAQAQQTLIALQRAQTQLIQAEKMSSLGQMVAGIAHEINNPVNFIHGNLQHIEQYINDILKLLKLYEKHYPEPA